MTCCATCGLPCTLVDDSGLCTCCDAAVEAILTRAATTGDRWSTTTVRAVA